MAPSDTPRSGGKALILRLCLALAIVALVVWLGYAYGGTLTLASLAAREVELRNFYRDHPLVTLAVAFLLYAAVAGLSIPGSVPLSLAYGWLFGFWTGVVLVSFASTTGASLAFLMSRYLIGSCIQARFGERLAAFNQTIEQEGAFYLFTLRLITAVPFTVTNLVMGLTKIRFWTFWWVSQLGMLPATCIFVGIGASAPSLAVIQAKGASSLLSVNIMLALVALGLFPLAARWTVKWLGQRKDQATTPP